MQTSAMKACFQIAECSLSYTKDCLRYRHLYGQQDACPQECHNYANLCRPCEWQETWDGWQDYLEISCPESFISPSFMVENESFGFSLLVLFYLLNRTKFAFYPSKRLLSDSSFYSLLGWPITLYQQNSHSHIILWILQSSYLPTFTW